MIATNDFSTRQALKAPKTTESKPDPKTVETALLVQMVQSKSERGFNILYDRYSNALYSKLIKIVGHTEVADDLLQDTFVKIWKNINQFDPAKGALFTWMLNIARNQAIDYLRSPTRKNQLQNISIDLLLHHQDHFGGTTSNNSPIEFKDFKTKALQIDQKYAEVIDMIIFYGCTYQQTAQLLKLPIGTVKTRARKGLSILKILYQQ